jgi:hypothetical protein
VAAFEVVKVANSILIEDFLNPSKGFIGDNGQCAISVNGEAVESQDYSGIEPLSREVKTPRDSDLSVSIETAKKKTTLGEALKLPISPCSGLNVEDVKIHGEIILVFAPCNARVKNGYCSSSKYMLLRH